MWIGVQPDRIKPHEPEQIAASIPGLGIIQTKMRNHGLAHLVAGRFRMLIIPDAQLGRGEQLGNAFERQAGVLPFADGEQLFEVMRAVSRTSLRTNACRASSK